MSEDNYIIKVEKITKEYQNKKILGPLNLNIKKGDKIAVIGTNGSGKTTLCEMANLRIPIKYNNKNNLKIKII